MNGYLNRVTVVMDFRGYKIKVWESVPHKEGAKHILEGHADMMGPNPEVARVVHATVTGENQIITTEQLGKALETLRDVTGYEITSPWGNGVRVQLR